MNATADQRRWLLEEAYGHILLRQAMRGAPLETFRLEALLYAEQRDAIPTEAEADSLRAAAREWLRGRLDSRGLLGVRGSTLDA